MTRKMITIILLALVVLSMAVTPAFAGTTTEQSKVTVTLNGGSTYGFLDTFGDPAFPAVTLNGAAQTLTGQTVTNADNTFVVADDRGTGLGWKVTAQCSSLLVEAAPTKVFAQNSITMPQWSAVVADGGSSPVSGWTMPAGATIDNASGVVMMNTGAGSGMGKYTVTVPNTGWGLAVTADEFAGSYTSTLTLTWASL